MTGKNIKRGVLFLILILPSAIYIALTTGNHNFVHLPIVGGENPIIIPDFSFPNQFGDTITSADYAGNVYVANFVFTTCPTICPVMTYQMRRVQQKFENSPNFVKPIYSILNSIHTWH